MTGLVPLQSTRSLKKQYAGPATGVCSSLPAFHCSSLGSAEVSVWHLQRAAFTTGVSSARTTLKSPNHCWSGRTPAASKCLASAKVRFAAWLHEQLRCSWVIWAMACDKFLTVRHSGRIPLAVCLLTTRDWNSELCF